jgi:hypothetical protein
MSIQSASEFSFCKKGEPLLTVGLDKDLATKGMQAKPINESRTLRP